jgi:KDO2-lipid IV(A) lauroyltransferase
MGAALGWIAGSLLRIRRAHVEGAMRRAGIAEPAASARAMYGSLGRSVFEFLWMASRGEEATARAAFDAASGESWQKAVALGRGVVLAASHTGNWDLAACALARETRLLVVTKHLSARSLDAFWQTTRAHRGVALASAEGAVARSLALLQRGGSVAMMIDQVPASPLHAVRGDFLGAGVWCDRAAAALAARARAPLVVAASRRDAQGAHVLHMLGVFVPPARPGRAWIDEVTASATRELERFVRAYPSQWLWLHRRWKAPAGVDRPDERAMLAAPCANRLNGPSRNRKSTPSTPPTRSSSPAAPSGAG